MDKKEMLNVLNSNDINRIKLLHKQLFSNSIIDWNCSICRNNAINKLREKINKL